MVNQSSYPPSWHEVHTINASAPGAWWSDWTTEQARSKRQRRVCAARKDAPSRQRRVTVAGSPPFIVQGGTCAAAPRATVRSAVGADGASQSATWDITVQE